MSTHLVRVTDDVLIMLPTPSHLIRDGDVFYSDPEWQRRNSHLHRMVLMVRLGSALDTALVAFRGCVKRNKDRKLYEMEECVDPFSANRQRIPDIRNQAYQGG